MDGKALNHHFDFASLGSIYEKKKTLLLKLNLVESRVAE